MHSFVFRLIRRAYRAIFGAPPRPSFAFNGTWLTTEALERERAYIRSIRF